jgi:hypothetical protein
MKAPVKSSFGKTYLQSSHSKGLASVCGVVGAEFSPLPQPYENKIPQPYEHKRLLPPLSAPAFFISSSILSS